MVGILDAVIEAPRRTSPLLNGDGQYALFSESTYSLSAHEGKDVTLVLDLKSGERAELPSDGKNFAWVEPSTNIVWQKQTETDTELWVCDAADVSTRSVIDSLLTAVLRVSPIRRPYADDNAGRCQIASFRRSAVLFQAVVLANGDLGALLYKSEVYNPSDAYPRSSGRVFTSFPCLTFDEGVGRSKHSLLYLRISRSQDAPDHKVAGYETSNEEPIDVLAGSRLEFFPYSGSMPNISTPNCAISSSGVALIAQHIPNTSIGRFTTEAYFVPLPDPGKRTFAPPTHLPTGTYNGWCALPVFSRDGRKLAFLREEKESQICIARQVFIVKDLSKISPKSVGLVDDSGNQSHLYPEMVQWSPDGKTIYFLACDVGRVRLFSIDPESVISVPARVAPIEGRSGSVLAASIQGKQSGPGRCLLVETTLTSPNRFFVLDFATKAFDEVPKQNIPDFGLRANQVSEVWIENEGHKIHTFIVRPSGFDPSKKWPVALLIHGGPVYSWVNAFSLIWTFPVYAEEGYVLVMPNVIGSTGYSREFREAAFGHFASKTYSDLEACMDWVGKELPYVDTNRAVSLGGSYGAYMNYWIAGKPLGKRFKALISHAGGGFGNTSFYHSDLAEVYPRYLTAVGETFDPADVEKTMFRSDPAQFAKNWSTPMLLTHGGKDNRCPPSNSYAAFAHCQHLGIESKLVVFPDESHFILKPENSYHWHKEFFEFMDKYAKE